MEMKTSLRSIYKAGCLYEYGDLNNSSIVNFAFDEAIHTCINKSLSNVTQRACKVLRKLLLNLSNQELMDRAGTIRFYREYYADNRQVLVEKVVRNLASSFVVKYQEWEEKNESADIGR